MTHTIQLNGSAFYNALNRVALATSKDTSVHVLGVVEVTVYAGRAYLIATDRYRIHADSVALGEDVSIEDGAKFYLNRAVASEIKRFNWHKARSATGAEITWDSETEVSISTVGDEGEGALICRATAIENSDYPKLNRLLTGAMEAMENGDKANQVAYLCVNPEFVADMLKVRRFGFSKATPLVLDSAPHKAHYVLAQFAAEDSTFRALIMPTRVTDDLADRATAHKEVKADLAAALS